VVVVVVVVVVVMVVVVIVVVVAGVFIIDVVEYDVNTSVVVVASASVTELLTVGTDVLSIKSLAELASTVVKPDVTAFVTVSASEDRSPDSGITVSYTTVTFAVAELDLLCLPVPLSVNIIITDTKRISLFDATKSRPDWKTADTSAAAAMYSSLVVSDSAVEYVIVVTI